MVRTFKKTGSKPPLDNSNSVHSVSLCNSFEYYYLEIKEPFTYFSLLFGTVGVNSERNGGKWWRKQSMEAEEH